MSIGLIGNGVVGGAVRNAYEKVGITLSIVDVGDDIHAVDNCSVVWVCVPETELEKVAANYKNHDGLFIVRSTALPHQFKNLFKRLAYVPEFLTERNANEDFYTPPLQPIGTRDVYDYSVIMDQFEVLKVNTTNAFRVTPEEASLIKYYANCYLATKVIFNHEYEMFCKEQGVDWEMIARVCKEDKRLGTTHWQAPGFDGYGYSGKCFPKDVRNLIRNSDRLKLLHSVDAINNEMRSSSNG